jgi:hypothetical protein
LQNILKFGKSIVDNIEGNNNGGVPSPVVQPPQAPTPIRIAQNPLPTQFNNMGVHPLMTPQMTQQFQPAPINDNTFIGRNFINPIVNDVESIYHPVAAGLAGAGGLVRIGGNALIGNKQAEQSAIQQTNQAIANQLNNPNSSLTYKDATSGNTGQLVKSFTKEGIRLAPYFVAPGVGKVVENAVAPSFISRAGKGALQFGSLNAGSTAAQEGLDGHINPGDVAKSFAMGAAFGGGLPILHAGVSAVGRNIIGDIKPVEAQTPEMAMNHLNDQFNQLDNQRTNMMNQGLEDNHPDMINNFKQMTEVHNQQQALANQHLQPTPQPPEAPRVGKTEAPQPIKIAKPSKFNTEKYLNELDKAQETARKTDNPILKDQINKHILDLKTKLVDSFTPIENTLNKAKKNGYEVAPANDITYQIDRALRTDTISGQYIIDNGLDKIIQNVPSTKALDQYMISKHAVDLNNNGITTGRNLSKDAKLVDALKEQYEPYAQALNAYSQKLLDETVNYGLISKENAAFLKEKYPNYVPFNRIFTEEELQNGFKGTGAGKASISQQSIVQKIKGSERTIESPIASIIKKTQDVIEQGERNKAATLLTSYKDIPGNPFELRELAPSETVGTKPVISFLDNGVQRRFETTPEVAAAAKSLNKQQLGLLGQIFAVPTRLLRLGATGLNPAFALRNVTKDIDTAFINSKHPIRTLADPEVFMSALKAALQHNSAEHGELVRQAAGGTSFDIARNADINNIAKIRANKNSMTKAIYTVTRPSELLRAAENTIGRSEEFGRAAQYFGNKKAFKLAGKSEADSQILGANAARNNTVNFARAGDYGRVLNTVLPYLNAGIQGSRTLLRNLQERPLQTSAKIVITASLPVAVTTMWNISDEKRKKAYDDITDTEKQNNIIIIPPNPHQDANGRWNVIKIPVSQEIANINNIVRNGVETMMNDGTMNAREVFGNLIGTVTSLNVQNPRQLVGQFTPQAVKPEVEALTNQNLYTGQQIVPDALKNLQPEDQYMKSTSGTAKVIGRNFNISPLLVDNAIKTGAAGLGQNVINLADNALAQAGIINKNEVKGKSLLPSITQGFTSAQGQTPGSIYFTNLQLEAKKQNLAGKDYEFLNAMITKETDQNGNPVPTDIRTKLDNSTLRATHPRILAVETAAAKATSNRLGTPLDPFYNLTPDQQKTIVVIEARKAFDNSDNLAQKMKLDNPWTTDFYKQRADYFQKLDQANATTSKLNEDGTLTITNSDGTTRVKGALSMPVANQDVVNAMQGAKGLTGADYAKYMDSHPELRDYYAKLDTAIRAQHDYFNEPQYKKYPTPSVRVNQLLNSMPQGSDTQSRAARAMVMKDPEVSNYMADVTSWQLNKGAALAQFEGQDYTQKDLKNIYAYGNYDIAKLANGQYAQTAGTLSDGTKLAGNGYTTGGSSGFTVGTAPSAGGYSKKPRVRKARKMYIKRNKVRMKNTHPKIRYTMPQQKPLKIQYGRTIEPVNIKM